MGKKEDQAKWYTKNASRHKENVRAYKFNKRNELRKIVRSLKENPCTDCGMCYPHFVMDFDHIEDNKLMNVSVMIGQCRSKKMILAEIAKCELVCANCHRIRTSGRLAKLAKALAS